MNAGCRAACVVALVVSMAAGARAEGWSFWPFSSRDKDASSVYDPSYTQDESALRRVGRGTQNFFSATANALTFGHAGGDSEKEPPLRGSVWRHERPVEAWRHKPKSFLSSLLGTREPQRPRTVGEFLSQPRPGGQ